MERGDRLNCPVVRPVCKGEHGQHTYTLLYMWPQVNHTFAANGHLFWHLWVARGENIKCCEIALVCCRMHTIGKAVLVPFRFVNTCWLSQWLMFCDAWQAFSRSSSVVNCVQPHCDVSRGPAWLQPWVDWCVGDLQVVIVCCRRWCMFPVVVVVLVASCQCVLLLVTGASAARTACATACFEQLVFVLTWCLNVTQH